MVVEFVRFLKDLFGVFVKVVGLKRSFGVVVFGVDLSK